MATAICGNLRCVAQRGRLTLDMSTGMRTSPKRPADQTACLCLRYNDFERRWRLAWRLRPEWTLQSRPPRRTQDKRRRHGVMAESDFNWEHSHVRDAVLIQLLRHRPGQQWLLSRTRSNMRRRHNRRTPSRRSARRCDLLRLALLLLRLPPILRPLPRCSPRRGGGACCNHRCLRRRPRRRRRLP